MKRRCHGADSRDPSSGRQGCGLRCGIVLCLEDGGYTPLACSHVQPRFVIRVRRKSKQGLRGRATCEQPRGGLGPPLVGLSERKGASDGLALGSGRDGRRAMTRRATTARTDEGAVVMRRGERPAGRGQFFLNCPRCGLTIKVRAPWLAIRFCPRCLARSQTIVGLFSFPLPAEVLYTEGSTPSRRSLPQRSTA
jgi:hypothetical protein